MGNVDWAALIEVLLKGALAIYAQSQAGTTNPGLSALAGAAVVGAIGTSIRTGNASGLMALIPTKPTVANLPKA